MVRWVHKWPLSHLILTKMSGGREMLTVTQKTSSKPQRWNCYSFDFFAAQGKQWHNDWGITGQDHIPLLDGSLLPLAGTLKISWVLVSYWTLNPWPSLSPVISPTEKLWMSWRIQFLGGNQETLEILPTGHKIHPSNTKLITKHKRNHTNVIAIKGFWLKK